MTKGAIHSGSTTEKVLDRLVVDGGWFASSLMCELYPESSPNTLHQALMRLRDKGWVESRRLGGGFGNQELEWRIHPDFEWPE